MASREIPQPLLVGRTQHLEVPQNECSGVIANRHFDLGDPLALVQRADQFGQRTEQRTQMCRQHLATAHVGHVA